MDKRVTNLNRPNKDLLYSEKAEKNLLGCMMYIDEAADYAFELLSDSDFYNKANSIIFSAMKELHRMGRGINNITVGDFLATKGKEHLTGGVAYLEDLTNLGFLQPDYDSYIQTIAEKSQLRKLIRASQEIIDQAYTSTESAEVLEFAEKKLFEISVNSKKLEFSNLSNVMDDVLLGIRDMPLNPGQLTGIDTGFYDLNSNLYGFQNTDLIILAARPSMGKTALALNFVRNAAVKGGANVAVFSLEMSKEQLALRMMAMGSTVELSKIKTGNLREPEFELLADCMKEYRKTNIFVSECPGAKIGEIRSQCRKIKSRHGLDMIVIDYLQLMSGDGENQQIMVSNISRSLKSLAMEMDCPVIALSQLSRRLESRTNRRPILSDLRDSGSIEQDADIVMMLFREESYDKDNPALKGKAELNIAKHRNGEVGTVILHWKPEYQLFMSVAMDEAYPEGF